MDNKNLDNGYATTPSAREDKSSISKTMEDADDAMKVFSTLQSQRDLLNSVSNKRLLRKIDSIIMPLLCLVYAMQFLDKTTISYANVMNFQNELGLTGQDYSWLGSIFFFGFLGMELVAGRVLQKLPLGKCLGITIIIWGVVAASFASVQNYPGAIASRFFLGIFEACVSPGFVLVISQWYKLSEQSFRTSIWVCFAGLAQVFGGLVAYGIAHKNSIHPFSIAPWRVLFLVNGILTILIGIIFLIVIPDNQLNAWWLSPQNRILAIERVRSNQQGIGNRTFKLHQFKEALKDPFTWAVFFLGLAADVPSGALGVFFSELIVSFGFTPLQSLLYGTPAGGVSLIVVIGTGILSHRYGHRMLWGAIAMAITMIGVILIVALPLENRVGRLVGYYLTTSVPAGLAMLLSLISSNVAGYTKKTTVAAMFFVGYCVGNIIGPQTFRAQDAPHYVSAEIVIIVLLAASIADMLFIYCYFRRQNKKKERGRREESYIPKAGIEFLDLTDWENPEFVYML